MPAFPSGGSRLLEETVSNSHSQHRMHECGVSAFLGPVEQSHHSDPSLLSAALGAGWKLPLLGSVAQRPKACCHGDYLNCFREKKRLLVLFFFFLSTKQVHAFVHKQTNNTQVSAGKSESYTLVSSPFLTYVFAPYCGLCCAWFGGREGWSGVRVTRLMPQLQWASCVP